MVRNDTFSGFYAGLARFRDNRSGVAALEFALIAPIMFLLLFTAFELTDAAAANRRIESAAGSLADVVARDTLVTDEEIQGLFVAADWIVYPTPAAQVQARVTSVFIDEDGRAEVEWSEGRGLAPLSRGAAIAIPDGLRVPETGLVVAETSATYRSPLGLLSMDGSVISKVEYRRPRIMDPVMRDDG